MKKLLLLALSFGLLASCSKDDKNGIPPVDPNKPTDKPATALEAKDLKVADYESYRDKKEKVKLHGEIAEVTNGRSYFKFSDGTLVQIFTHEKNLKEETTKKLKIVGQELTVVGVFTDYKLKDDSIVKEILYESEADLTFGKTPEVKPEQPVVTLEASTATVNDYKVGEVVKIHGNITVQTEGKYKRSYFKFSDGTLIQFYVRDYEKNLSQEIRTKLETEGQEVTVKGTFKTYTKTDKKTGTKTDIRQIVYESAADLTF
ncbi:hypothetical protein [Capnocytophaga granulosa]|uniref:hypothetical protein n=1 Tax=Capnocytophaga granulosa TaxID=45242 RepID=UPI003C786C0C